MLEQVAMLFLMMVTGYIANKVKILTDEVIGKMTDLVLLIAAPCMIVTSFQFDFSQEILVNVLLIAAGACAMHFLTLGLGKLAFIKLRRDKRVNMWFATVFPNAAFMGYPVLNTIFGKIGVLYGAVYVCFFYIFLWTAGVMLFTGEKNLKSNLTKALLNPGLIATGIGIVLFACSLRLPAVLNGTLESVGGLTTPLSMMLVGARLGSVRLGKIFSAWSVYLFSVLRLIGLPLLVFGLLRLCNMPAAPTGVLTVIAAMPAAANTMLFSQRYNLNPGFASQLVFISTVISVLTIPALLWLLGM